MSARKCQCPCCRKRDAEKKSRWLKRMGDLKERAEAAGLVFEPITNTPMPAPAPSVPEEKGEGDA